MSRYAYEKCTAHKRTYCCDPTCKREEQIDSDTATISAVTDQIQMNTTMMLIETVIDASLPGC